MTITGLGMLWLRAHSSRLECGAFRVLTPLPATKTGVVACSQESIGLLKFNGGFLQSFTAQNFELRGADCSKLSAGKYAKQREVEDSQPHSKTRASAHPHKNQAGAFRSFNWQCRWQTFGFSAPGNQPKLGSLYQNYGTEFSGLGLGFPCEAWALFSAVLEV